jgi:hypothetical protein
MLLLWICGIVLFAEHPEGVKAMQISGSSSEPPVSTESLKQQWTTPSGQKLFGSLKDLYKTINLTCLNVLWILKGEVVGDEAIEGIRIASRVLRFIDRNVKDSWPKSDTMADSLFKRYPAKIVGSDITPPVLFEALSFYAVLAGPKSLPQEIVMEYEFSISKAARIADQDCIAENLSVSLPLFGVSAPCYCTDCTANRGSRKSKKALSGRYYLISWKHVSLGQPLVSSPTSSIWSKSLPPRQ